jgi:hypothetical protein
MLNIIKNPHRLAFSGAAAMKRIINCLFLVGILTTSGCSYIIGSATQNLANTLSNGILNNDDLKTVEQGLPAYLLLLDGLIEDDPDNLPLLQSASRLNSTYASVFTNDKEQAKKLSDKAFNFAIRAVCKAKKSACEINTLPFNDFKTVADSFNKKEIGLLYTLGTTWASRIEAHNDDWNAIAQIGQVQHIMERVVILDEMYDSGAAHLYLGTLATLLPPAMGGKPEVGRQHFERAITLSDGKNLMAKVTYAQRYARLLFERPLHDQLLKDVINAPAHFPGLTLINTLAQQQAHQLLKTADDYF